MTQKHQEKHIKTNSVSVYSIVKKPLLVLTILSACMVILFFGTMFILRQANEFQLLRISAIMNLIILVGIMLIILFMASLGSARKHSTLFVAFKSGVLIGFVSSIVLSIILAIMELRSISGFMVDYIFMFVLFMIACSVGSGLIAMFVRIMLKRSYSLPKETGYKEKKIKPTSTVTRKEVQESEEVVGFFTKIGWILSKPSKLYSNIKHEKIGNAFVYYLIISVLFKGLWDVYALMLKYSIRAPQFIDILRDPINPGSLFHIYYKLWLIWLPSQLILIFLVVLVFHGFARLFGGQGKYAESFKVLVYGMTPSSLFGWIVPIVFHIWSIVLWVKGFNRLHSLTTWKSIFVLLLGTIIIFIVISITVGIASYIALTKFSLLPV
jgi:hypothetical protein